jgi:hypothetical protein
VAEADPEEQARFEKTQQQLDVGRLVFVDEFGVNTAMTRDHARFPQGERAEATEPFNGGSNVSVISVSQRSKSSCERRRPEPSGNFLTLSGKLLRRSPSRMFADGLRIVAILLT